MIRRCRNDTRKNYALYGGRGISVCDRWLKFENFLADMGERPLGKSLDRINNDGNYDPKNCRWADHFQQARNRRGNSTLTVGGVTKTYSEWSAMLGGDRGLVADRMRRGWAPELAVSKPRKP
jgi:hypothetical protein